MKMVLENGSVKYGSIYQHTQGLRAVEIHLDSEDILELASLPDDMIASKIRHLASRLKRDLKTVDLAEVEERVLGSSGPTKLSDSIPTERLENFAREARDAYKAALINIHDALTSDKPPQEKAPASEKARKTSTINLAHLMRDAGIGEDKRLDWEGVLTVTGYHQSADPDVWTKEDDNE